MLLTLSTTHRPATDLGYLLYKNPARAQSISLNFGEARVFYPEATEERCTAAMWLDIDPVGLVRNRRGPSGEGFSLEQYLNDRPFVASSFMSVAIGQVFGSALSGSSRERPELAARALPFVATLAVVPCRNAGRFGGGEALLRALFEPLGYEVVVTHHPLDEHFPEWGESPYFSLELRGMQRLTDLLSHLYVLIPVLDGDKHYWIGDDEVDKLLRHGEGWLAAHPSKQLIIDRYFNRKRGLAREAVARLLEEESPTIASEEVDATTPTVSEEAGEKKRSLNDQRLGAVMAVLKSSGATRVLDLGCSNGNLLKLLLADRQFEQIVGYDVSLRSLEIASDRLHLDRMPPMQRKRIELMHGSLGYRDKRLSGFDAAAVVEVIEHLDPPRLAAFERALFEFAKPPTIVMTTPNIEYNVKFETLETGTFRHRDHRFEWSREQFQAWGNRLAERFGYVVRFLSIGEEDPIVGSATQMGIFETNSD